MNNILTYTIELRDRMSPTFRRVGVNADEGSKKVNRFRSEVERLDRTPLNNLPGSFGRLFKSLSPMQLLTTGLQKLNRAAKDGEAAYTARSVAEARLMTVMRNTMGAGGGELKSVLALTAAQQKLGVVGQDVQLAGAQELAGWLKRKESLEKLLPAMNDMIARQHGLNAGQEHAVSIASMLGSAMAGQTDSLSRYGLKLTRTQEAMLKNGEEAQRAAVLYDVVTASVGGVNRALAQTPAGRLHQDALQSGARLERLGSLVVTVRNAFQPLREYVRGIFDSVLSFFETHRAAIEPLVLAISNVVASALKRVGSVVFWVFNAFRKFVEGVRDGRPVFVAIAAVVARAAAILIAYKAVMTVVTVATRVWAGVQAILNGVMMLNPIGLIVAAIVALIAVIAYVAMTTEGWGETWNNVMQYMKLGIELFKSQVSLIWLNIKDTFLGGFEVIEEGWYRLQSLWDKDAAREGLDRLRAERDARAEEIAGVRDERDGIARQMRDMQVWAVRSNGKGLGDVTNSLTSKLGIPQAGLPGMGGTGAAGLSGFDGGGFETAGSAGAIAAGGSKTTHVTINLDTLVNTMNINSGSTGEGAAKMRDVVLDELTRVLTMAQSNA